MGRKTRLLFVLTGLVILPALILAGCLGTNKTLVGRWDYPDDNGYLIFKADGTFTWLDVATISEGTWRSDELKVYMKTNQISLVPRG